MRVTAKAASDLSTASLDRAMLIYSELQPQELSLRSPLASYKSVVAGVEHYRLGSEQISLGAKQSFLAPAEEDISVQIVRMTKGQCLYFKPQELFTHIAGAQSASLEEDYSFTHDVFGLRLPKVTDLPRAHNGILDHSDFDAFLFELATQLVRTQRLTRSIDLQRSANAIELVARLETARGFILDNLEQTLTLNEIAKAACLSRYHLSRQFSSAYDLPPLRFHQYHRLRRAKKRLAKGESPTAIAQSLGFSELAAFSRAYKRVHGCPPSAHSSNIGQSH